MDILHFCRITKEDGSTVHEWRTFGDLLERVQEITEGAGEIDHIRWEGIPDARDEGETLPYVDTLSLDVSRHWHDGIPKIRLYGIRKDGGDLTAVYLYGLVYDPSSGRDDWEGAFQVAGRIRGALCPNGSRRHHPDA